jgi:hypothetical protein
MGRIHKIRRVNKAKQSIGYNFVVFALGVANNDEVGSIIHSLRMC